jgi:hypothetical protein
MKSSFLIVATLSLGAVACFSAGANDENLQATAVSQVSATVPDHVHYAWLQNTTADSMNCLANRFDVPAGFHRVAVDSGSFGEWLRYLPLHPEGKKVLLYNGNEKRRQDVHVAVINIDPGTTDLQQCADATMRLRAEYLFSAGKYGSIHFNYTSGDRCDYSEWCNGVQLKVNGNKVTKVNTGRKSEISEHGALRTFMNNVFTYAGTLSLAKEMISVTSDSIQIGDVFIQGGSPGHAVIVVDMCSNSHGEKLFMLAQSYMPAQEIHVLKNFNEPSISPWYRVPANGELNTPEWDFKISDLKRFSDE